MNHMKGERKMKRLTVAAIIAVMVAGVFTGCGNAGTAQTTMQQETRRKVRTVRIANREQCAE